MHLYSDDVAPTGRWGPVHKAVVFTAWRAQTTWPQPDPTPSGWAGALTVSQTSSPSSSSVWPRRVSCGWMGGNICSHVPNVWWRDWNKTSGGSVLCPSSTLKLWLMIRRLFYFMSCNSHIITHDGINTVYSLVTVCPTLVATENIEL